MLSVAIAVLWAADLPTPAFEFSDGIVKFVGVGVGAGIIYAIGYAVSKILSTRGSVSKDERMDTQAGMKIVVRALESQVKDLSQRLSQQARDHEEDRDARREQTEKCHQEHEVTKSKLHKMERRLDVMHYYVANLKEDLKDKGIVIKEIPPDTDEHDSYRPGEKR